MERNMRRKFEGILARHIEQVQADGITYEERRLQAERERFDGFVLSVGSVLHSHGIRFNYNGLVGAKPALKRLQKFSK